MNSALLIMGVALLPVLYHVAFPIRLPKLENYFAPGQSFHSEAEGITMNILRQEGTRVHCEFRFSPGAGCQLQHHHEHFDQSGTVTKGTLVLRADKQLVRISAGGRVHLPRGTPHLMSNRGTGEVLLRCEGEQDALPVSYAYGLAKRYPLNRSKSLNLRLYAMTCVLESHFDSVPHGWTPFTIRMLRKLAKPYARLWVGRSAQ